MNPGETERCEVCQGYPEWCEGCTLRQYLKHLVEKRKIGKLAEDIQSEENK